MCNNIIDCICEPCQQVKTLINRSVNRQQSYANIYKSGANCWPMLCTFMRHYMTLKTEICHCAIFHEDVFKLNHFPLYWPIVWGIHRSQNRDLSLCNISWRYLHMKSFFALLAHCVGNSPVTGEFPAQKVQWYGRWCFFNVGPHKLLNEQINSRWYETTWRPCDVIVMFRHCRRNVEARTFDFN